MELSEQFGYGFLAKLDDALYPQMTKGNIVTAPMHKYRVTVIYIVANKGDRRKYVFDVRAASALCALDEMLAQLGSTPDTENWDFWSAKVTQTGM